MRAEGGLTKRIVAIVLICSFITPALFVLPGVSADSGNTLYVDSTNCPNTGDGTTSDPFCSINDAVAASASGDTIEIANGTYALTSSIEIYHPLTMIGAQDGTSALQRTSGDSSESVIDLRGVNNKILIFSSDVSVSGFDLHGDEYTRCGIYIAGGSNDLSNIEISDNLIHGMAMKLDSVRATSWGILTDAVEGGQILHTIDGLHIHGNHIYDIGGFNDSIGLGISIHEVVSSEVDGGALIENNRFSNIHDGKWAGAAGIDVPGMAVFTHEQTTMYAGDYLGGISLRSNEYANISVGAALQVSNAGVFDEHSGDFENVDVFMINVGHTSSVNETNLAPFAKSVGRNTSIQPPISVGESTAYFASPSLAVRNTLLGSQMEGHHIELSDGVFDETLVIQPTTAQANILISPIQDGSPIFTGGLLLQSNYMMDNITIEGITLQGEGATDVAFSIQASSGISDLSIRNMNLDGSNANGNQRSGIAGSGLAGIIDISGNHFDNLDGVYAFTTTPDGLDPGAGQISVVQFNDNTVIDSDSTLNIAPASGVIPEASISGNSFINSGLNNSITSNPMISITDVSSLTIEENILQNIHSTQGILVENSRFITIQNNNLTGVDSAITLEESQANTLQQAFFQDNSFTQIGTSAIEVPISQFSDVQINENWFGTDNETLIYEFIQGSADIGEQWNSWPGEDSDNDGWSDEFDLCEGYNDAVDIDQDGIPDGCDSILDNDDDGVANWQDNCPSIPNSDQANHDEDNMGDICDDNDDNDHAPDETDDCPLGNLGWAPTTFNDFDSDGCYDMQEDLDDDNDGIQDDEDLCQTGLNPNAFFSNSSIDKDGDGCKDSIEDFDDDGDGIEDLFDDCPLGEISWTSDTLEDFDGDGCRDITEDDDDDGDNVPDSMDECPREWINNVSDDDGNGCIDIIAEPPTPFIERVMQGELEAIGIVVIPLLILLGAGSILFSRQNRMAAERKLRARIDTAETPMHLTKVSNQAADMFVAKLISSQQHDEIQDIIRARRVDFGEDTVEASDENQKELARVFTKAVDLGLTTKEAVVRMERNIQAGRFSPEHYLDLWTKRIDDADIKAVVDEVVTSKDSPKEDVEFTLSTPAGWPTSKPSISALNRMKKAELVTLAKEMGVSHSGTKAQIIDALREEE